MATPSRACGSEHAPGVEAEDPRPRFPWATGRPALPVHRGPSWRSPRTRRTRPSSSPRRPARPPSRRAVCPTTGTEVPQVEDRGCCQQRQQRPLHPGRVALLAVHVNGPTRPPLAWGATRIRSAPGHGGRDSGRQRVAPAGSSSPTGGVGGGREVRHRDTSIGSAPGRALGRKIQARSTANRKTAATTLATVIATSSGTSAPGATHWPSYEPQGGEGEAQGARPTGDGEQATATALAVRRAGELVVDRRVEQGGDRHGDGVGTEGTDQRPPGDEEEEVAERGHHTHAGEAQELIGR